MSRTIKHVTRTWRNPTDTKGLLRDHRHVVDAAGGGHGRAVLRQHRHLRGAHAVHVWRDVVIPRVVGRATPDQTPDVVGKAFLQHFSGHLWEEGDS